MAQNKTYNIASIRKIDKRSSKHIFIATDPDSDMLCLTKTKRNGTVTEYIIEKDLPALLEYYHGVGYRILRRTRFSPVKG